MLSPQEAADRLGFSRQHVRRLIEAGELAGEQLPNSTHWKIPLRAVLDFEERRSEAEKRADEFSRSLDEMGAPAAVHRGCGWAPLSRRGRAELLHSGTHA